MTIPPTRYILGATVLILAVGAGALFYKAGHVLDNAVDFTDKSEVSIVLTDQGFEPAHVRIKAGTTVTFTSARDKQFWPASNPHPSHGLFPGFDPKRPIPPNESWSFVPDKPGVWGFHDHIRSYYTGILYVE